MIVNHMLAIVLAYIIDLIIGDPKHWPHPVKWMGNYIAYVDKKINKGRNKKLKGIFMLASLLFIVLTISLIFIYCSYQFHPLVGVFVEGVFIATTIAQKDLKWAAMDVYTPLKKGNIDEARGKLAYIVGRDTEHLTESEIARATIETVAENTTDGVTSPLFWAMIGGAPLALVYRAVNTCDSMVGYKNESYEQFGWASARLDDLLNWLPARLTSFVSILSIRPEIKTRKHAWHLLFRDAKKHNSPNSGWSETATAALLGIQLGGTNYYQSKKFMSPLIGEPFQPIKINHIKRAIKIMRKTIFIFLIIYLIGVVIYELACTWF